MGNLQTFLRSVAAPHTTITLPPHANQKQIFFAENLMYEHDMLFGLNHILNLQLVFLFIKLSHLI